MGLSFTLKPFNKLMVFSVLNEHIATNIYMVTCFISHFSFALNDYC